MSLFNKIEVDKNMIPYINRGEGVGIVKIDGYGKASARIDSYKLIFNSYDDHQPIIESIASINYLSYDKGNFFKEPKLVIGILHKKYILAGVENNDEELYAFYNTILNMKNKEREQNSSRIANIQKPVIDDDLDSESELSYKSDADVTVEDKDDDFDELDELERELELLDDDSVKIIGEDSTKSEENIFEDVIDEKPEETIEETSENEDLEEIINEEDSTESEDVSVEESLNESEGELELSDESIGDDAEEVSEEITRDVDEETSEFDETSVEESSDEEQLQEIVMEFTENEVEMESHVQEKIVEFDEPIVEKAIDEPIVEKVTESSDEETTSEDSVVEDSVVEEEVEEKIKEIPDDSFEESDNKEEISEDAEVKEEINTTVQEEVTEENVDTEINKLKQKMYQNIVSVEDELNTDNKNFVQYIPSQRQVDPVEQIRRYHELKEEGIISEEEFELKKKQLLNLEE